MTKRERTWGATPTRKPRMPLPKRWCPTKWLGEWEIGEGGSYDGEKWVRGLMWYREYAELDGHEDCCAHRWPVMVRVGEWVEDTSEEW